MASTLIGPADGRRIVPVLVGTPAQPGRCTLSITDTATVVLPDSVPVYVDPTTFGFAGRSLLLAGSPNYVPRVRHDSSPQLRYTTDSIFGVIRSPDGRWSVIPRPPQVRYFGAVRAAARGEGRWDVVFVQLDTTLISFPTEGPTRAAWHGIVTERGWERLQRLPLPPRDTIDVFNPGQLLRNGDTLTWAIRHRTLETGRVGGVGVLRAVGDRWTYQLAEANASAVQAVHFNGVGDRLFVRREAPPGTLHFELAMLALTPEPRTLAILKPSEGVTRWLPRAYQMADGAAAYAWTESRGEGESAMHVVGIDARGTPIGERLVPNGYTRALPLSITPGGAPWIFLGDRRSFDASGGPGVFELVLVSPSSARTAAEIPNAFASPPTHAVQHAGSAVVVGAVRYPRSGVPGMASAIATVGYACRESRDRVE